MWWWCWWPILFTLSQNKQGNGNVCQLQTSNWYKIHFCRKVYVSIKHSALTILHAWAHWSVSGTCRTKQANLAGMKTLIGSWLWATSQQWWSRPPLSQRDQEQRWGQDQDQWWQSGFLSQQFDRGGSSTRQDVQLISWSRPLWPPRRASRTFTRDPGPLGAARARPR